MFLIAKTKFKLTKSLFAVSEILKKYCIGSRDKLTISWDVWSSPIMKSTPLSAISEIWPLESAWKIGD